MRKLILFGDSNTYGYDPRDFLGGRYAEDERWATIVHKTLADSFDVVEEGMNGRQLPSVDYGYFTNLLCELSEDDISVIDASKWAIPMGSDGVHFSIDGHKKFAKNVLENLESF